MGRKFSEGDKEKVPQTVRIYWDEELQKFQEGMNYLYLQTGNMQDILNMNYWRFRNILRTLTKIKKMERGEQIIETKVPESSKDMIARFKELEGKKHGSR